jgi:GAF domain-containing protein
VPKRPSSTKTVSSRAASADLKAAQKRIADLEAREAEQARAERVQAALYRIAETASAATDMPSFYAAIHEIVGGLMYADNFYIALYDDQRELINYPFLRDEVETDLPDPNAWYPFTNREGKGATAFLLRRGRPTRLTLKQFGAMIAKGEMEAVGVLAVEWLGVPLKDKGKTIGVLAVQTYREDRKFGPGDLELLTFVGQHVASALTRARAIEETRQRNAELAIVNEIGSALARQLDYQAIIELVGERVSHMFESGDMFVASYNEQSKLVTFEYEIAEGERFYSEQMPLGPGLTSKVIKSRRPILISTAEEAYAQGAIADQIPAESWLGVPILAGERVLGVIALENRRPHAYGEADERLLSTLATSMGVALENARLFHETRRLLSETEQRNAELAVINEIGSALAKQLDFQAIIDLVGDRIRSIFEVQTGTIALLESTGTSLALPYSFDAGTRIFPNPIPLGEGLVTRVIGRRAPLRLGTAQEATELHALTIGPAENESWLGVPILAGDRTLGAISLERVEANGFTESDERLLSTLASSMGVALENARLFDETKRLLTETDERAAELALINEVQRGLAEKLDMQAMYDLVGDKIQEIFDAQGVDIEVYDKATGLISFPYSIELGQRLYDQPMELFGIRKHVYDSKAPLLINRDLEGQAEKYGQPPVLSGELAKSAVFVPMVSGDEVSGFLMLENLDHEDAFSEGDVRLITTLASSLSVALENARLFDETKRLLAETDERAAELAIINSVQEGLVENLDMQSMYDLVGDKIQEIFDAQVVDIAIYDKATNEFHFTYTIERGVRFPNEAMPFIGPRKAVIESREPLVFNVDVMNSVREYGQTGVISGEMPKSAVYAPMISSGHGRGVISLQNLDREHAFSPANVRLLMTLASSLSVALENARLFDETKRQKAETDERAAELALINEVQRGLAEKLDMQGMYDLVGDKIQEIFDAQVVDIGIYDREVDVLHFPYMIERGVRFADEPIQLRSGPVLGSVTVGVRVPSSRIVRRTSYPSAIQPRSSAKRPNPRCGRRWSSASRLEA